jgi:translation initiation factor 1A
MGRNMGKGGKGHKKMKNAGMEITSRHLEFAENGQEYAMVSDMLGGGRCNVITYSDKLNRLGIIRGNMRKRQVHRIGKNDIVLVSMREYQDNKCDIVHVYVSDEVKRLVAYGEITNEFITNNMSSMFKTAGTFDAEDEEDIIFEDIQNI